MISLLLMIGLCRLWLMIGSSGWIMGVWVVVVVWWVGMDGVFCVYELFLRWDSTVVMDFLIGGILFWEVCVCCCLCG